MPAIKKVEELLEYRLPQSGKSMSCIVLTREIAQKLVEEWYALLYSKGGETRKDAR